MSDLKTATVMSFARRLDVSDTTLYQRSSSDDLNTQSRPLSVREKSVRGTMSNRQKAAIANDPLKMDAEIQKPNLQTVDVSMLDDDCDMLVAKFSLKVLPFNGKPHNCNGPEYEAKLMATVKEYLDSSNIRELARRYALNILNARWLWRNRDGAMGIKMKVTSKIKQQVSSIQIEDALALPLENFEHQSDALNTLTDWIESGLKGPSLTMLYVEAHADIGFGQEVYPSQELVMDKGEKGKSKVLYTVHDKAGLHSQKVGNAVRHVDNWYKDAEKPVAAEPFAAVTTEGRVYRQPKDKEDFYTLFDNWVLKGKKPSVENQHYVISVLIRGGIFGASGKE